MTQYQLLDSYKKAGQSEADLTNEIKALTDATRTVVIEGDKLTLYAHLSDGYGNGLMELPAINSEVQYGTFVPDESLRDETHGELGKLQNDLWEESCLSGLFVGFDENGTAKLLPTTPTIIKDLPLLGINGPVTRQMNYYLVGLMANALKGKKVSLIIKTADDGTEKVFSMRSVGYMSVPQTEIYDFAKDLLCVQSTGELMCWDTSHFLTEATYQFPGETAVVTTKRGRRVEMTPHIRVGTSDTGDASIEFSLWWKSLLGTEFLAGGRDTASRKHSGKWNASTKAAFEKDVQQLVSKLQLLPQKIASLDAITVSNGDFCAVIDNLITDSKMRKESALGKAVCSAINNYTLNAIASFSEVSGADIVLTMMEALERVTTLSNLSELQKRILERCMAELPYCRIRGAVTAD